MRMWAVPWCVYVRVRAHVAVHACLDSPLSSRMRSAHVGGWPSLIAHELSSLAHDEGGGPLALPTHVYVRVRVRVAQLMMRMEGHAYALHMHYVCTCACWLLMLTELPCVPPLPPRPSACVVHMHGPPRPSARRPPRGLQSPRSPSSPRLGPHLGYGWGSGSG